MPSALLKIQFYAQKLNSDWLKQIKMFTSLCNCFAKKRSLKSLKVLHGFPE